MSDISRITKKPLGDLLVSDGAVSREHMEEALEEQRASRRPLAEVLMKRGFTTEAEVARVLCEKLQRPFFRPQHYDIPAEVLSLLPPRLLVEHCFIPIDRFGELLVLVLGDLPDAATLNQIQRLSACELDVYFGTPTDVKAALRDRFPELFDPITLEPIMDESSYTTSFRLEISEEEEDEMGGTTREIQGVADDDSDWEALFEEAERNVLRELKGNQ